MKRNGRERHLRCVEIGLGVQLTIGADLVARARQGDADAFTLIVDAHHAELVRVAYAVCGDADLAREAAQTTWIKVWQRLGGLREPDKLRPWLISIASNEARQAIRSRRRRRVREVPALDPESASDGPVVAAPTVDRPDLIGALERLDPDDRALIAMRYLAGLGSEEIAEVTGRSAGGVRARLSRLMTRLREDLGDD
jgi:RNA polymerase sigma-70 factor (ECF subfamily)